MSEAPSNGLDRVSGQEGRTSMGRLDPRHQQRLKIQEDSKKEIDLARRDEEKVDRDNPRARYIAINIDHAAQHAPKFDGNSVSTSKYNVITFLPLFLFEMFSRVAYLYFLIQACLSWWSVVSPFAGYGSTLALAFVLLVAAVKAILEDKKRHEEDHKTNNSTTTLVHWQRPDGHHHRGSHARASNGVAAVNGGDEEGTLVETEIKWRDVKVGDIIKVKDNELFPADLLCLYSNLPEDVCYVKTTNLDGETNLKVKRQVWEPEYSGVVDQERGLEEEAVKARLEMECEQPNSNLHHFKGKLGVYVPQRDSAGQLTGASKERFAPVTINEMLLRGCMLKNSGYVLGLVVYTGSETRIQRNSASAPLKIGSFDHFLNMQVAILITAQILLCVLCACLSYAWRENEGKKRYYLDFSSYTQGNQKNGFVYTILVFLTFWILYSYLVPISLFVTLEIVKFWQGFVFINFDHDMREPGSKEGARCRNSNLNEDLGKIDYVFSDKTGTLTSNEMRLRMIAIKGQVYGDPHQCLEDFDVSGMRAVERFDPKLAEALGLIRKDDSRWKASVDRGGSSHATLALTSSHPDLTKLGKSVEEKPFTGENGSFLPYHMMDFWTNLAMCHSLIVEDNPVEGGLPIYQGPSPDEVALVEGARQLGFEFLSRTSNSISISILGHSVEHRLLQMMEFSSERQRMSVIALAPDGKTIKLYCKGADAMMLKRLHPKTDPALLSRVDDNLHFFSTKGLRTLAIATRVLSQQEYEAWAQKYEAAQSYLGPDSEARMNAVCDEIERDLELIGVTAIEDKLQNAVPESINTLLLAGIKVWMITGDKQETAINIAVSCNLFKSAEHDDLLICNANSQEAAAERLEVLTRRAQESNALAGTTSAQLVIDGKTLNNVLGFPGVEERLAVLGSMCGAVVVCRASPSQKANIVNLMRRFEIAQAQKGKTWALSRWIARQNRNLGGKLLSIGDGANDVAMIQAADVGIGIAGKEGRQAVNNADYAITQFRHLTRLLLVHGTLSRYRLARLIKYSFYKNSCFAFVLFYFQFFCGFSGQTLIDDISAAVYNVIFTSLPILLFAVLDKPLQFSTMQHFPQCYNNSRGLSTLIFWKTGALHGIVDAAICFFIPYFAASPTGASSVNDIYSVGKTVFISMLGAVTIEVMIVARYWTVIFAVICFLSYALVYPFVLVFPLIEQSINTWDAAHFGVGINLFRSAYFWVSIVTCYVLAFGLRYLERSSKWLFRPDDNMLLAEIEALGGIAPGADTSRRLNAIRHGVVPPTDYGPLDNVKFQPAHVPPASLYPDNALCENTQNPFSPESPNCVNMPDSSSFSRDAGGERLTDVYDAQFIGPRVGAGASGAHPLAEIVPQFDKSASMPRPEAGQDGERGHRGVEPIPDNSLMHLSEVVSAAMPLGGGPGSSAAQLKALKPHKIELPPLRR